MESRIENQDHKRTESGVASGVWKIGMNNYNCNNDSKQWS